MRGQHCVLGALLTVTAHPANRRSIRVLTFNLWQRYGDWAARRAVLADGLRHLSPDVAGFAESIQTRDYDQVGDLLGPEFHLAHSKIRDPNGMGITMASRWPLQDVEEIDLNLTPRTAGFPGAALAAQIDAPNPVGPFLFVNHFPNWQLNLEYERELQTVAVARQIEARAAASHHEVILAGDMDADPESASIRFWCGRQSLGGISVCYRDAWESAHPTDPGATFTPENPLVCRQVVKETRPFRDWPFRRIDYIFVRFGAHGGSAFDILNCERIFDRAVNGTWASDHYGLVADLARPQPSQF